VSASAASQRQFVADSASAKEDAESKMEENVHLMSPGQNMALDDEGNIVTSRALPPPAQPQTASEHRRIKLCLVCGGPAETYHLNYGASACLSCRAFFR